MEKPNTVPRVIIAGVRGYGAHHLENARRLQTEGRLRLVALADPAVGESPLDGTPVYADLESALREHDAETVIVATPIDTHRALCAAALKAGADVLLEKPPVATMADYEALVELQQRSGRAVQLGFQSLGSHALEAFAADAFGLGELVAVSAQGTWTRPRRYWSRARWAGRRALDGHPVVDGVTTNPLAHAVATALRIAGYEDAASVTMVETDLYRVNAIEADDTSVVRISGDGRVPVVCALTLCAAPGESGDRAPIVTVIGTQGRAQFSYTADAVTAGGRHVRFGRQDLLVNLLEHRVSGEPLLAPLGGAGAFMRVVDAVRTAAEPTRVPGRFVEWRSPDGDLAGPEAYPVLDAVDDWVARAAEEGRTFAELGAPWARG